MSIFSLFKSGSLTPRWSYTCDGILWRMLFSKRGHLLGEVRNPETKRATFFCVNERTGELFWKDKSFEEPWWIGIEDITDDFVFFHSFIKPDMPQHAGMIACSASDGHELWKETKYTFLHAENDKVYVSKEGFEDIHFYALENASGKILEDLGNDSTIINHLRSENDDAQRYKDYLYPSSFDASHSEYAFLHSIVDQYVDKEKLKGNVDLLLFDENIIFCWHEVDLKHPSDKQLLQQPIKIFNLNLQKIVFDDLVNTNVALPGVDSFFMKNEMLFYIKNMNEIKAIDLHHN